MVYRPGGSLELDLAVSRFELHGKAKGLELLDHLDEADQFVDLRWRGGVRRFDVGLYVLEDFACLLQRILQAYSERSGRDVTISISSSNSARVPDISGRLEKSNPSSISSPDSRTPSLG